jgi:tetratricopeptide (TPR) repeat protein
VMAVSLTTSRWRRPRHHWLLCSGLALVLGSAQAQEALPSLRYGSMLFYYFQQDYFNALTELMVAQQHDELGVSADNAELLRGGVSLSYGMDRVAQQVFETLLVAPDASIDRDQAWFYLAKMAWQRDDLDRSAAALAKMDTAYEGPLAPEANYLRASIALHRGDEQLVASYDTLFPRNSPWPYYLYYNLGATYAARGDWDAAVDYFHRLDKASLSTPEIYSLRDKAMTASGYARLAAGNFKQAAKDFTRVRLDGPLVDRALLGYGWAHSEMGDYQAALSPWQVLGDHSLLNDSVRESLLAIPYAYEQLGRRQTALQQYRHASDVYARQLQAVRAAIESLRDGDLARQHGALGGFSQDWLSARDVLPMGEHLPYLSHLMTKQAFQIALRELQDLHDMAFYLSTARQRLQMLARVDQGQQEGWSPLLEGNRFTLLKNRQQQLQAQVEQQRQRLAAADEAEDIPRLRNAVQQLQALAQESAQRVLAVEEAIALRQRTNYVPRIDALRARVQSEELRVQTLIGNAREYVSQLAVAELQLQSAKLDKALAQSRLAFARLYDVGSPQAPR